jgi:hypothetical protein
VPFQSTAQLPRREEVGVSFAALGILELASSMPLISISRNLALFEKLSWKIITQKSLL